MRTVGIWTLFTMVSLAGSAAGVAAQEPETTTRQTLIEQGQSDKGASLSPFGPGKAERLINKAEDILVNQTIPWYPFFSSAYAGGGFTLGAGYRRDVSANNFVDVRGSYSIAGYKRVEAEFTAPHLFNRRGQLSVLGGWREATQVGFYGLGNETSKDDRTNYAFREPHVSASLEFLPTRKLWVLGASVEMSRWSLGSGSGAFPPIDSAFTPDTLSGLGTSTTYIHSQATAGFDWRTSPGYSRRGGFYGVTAHDYTDRDKAFGFQQVDYEAVQHIPILREAWVLSFHGLARTAFSKSGQQVPFFMLPALGGGSSLRGFASWRFRDENSLLMQAEWRISVNRFLDTAVFYDAGKVTAHASDLDLNDLNTDYGFGLRFHGPLATPLRVELARSREGLSFVFSAASVF